MPFSNAKSRVTYAEMCARLARSGFQIRHLSQFDLKEALDLTPKLHLQIVVMNRGNLALEVKGPITPPYWGEDLFYKLISKVELFEDNYGH
ncbi:MAG: hypothetical protein ACYDHF_06285 [Candidatus Cryosericum sp.]